MNGVKSGAPPLLLLRQIPGFGRGIDHADGVLALPGPVADHRLPAGAAELDYARVGTAGADLVAEIPGAGGRIEDADTGMAGAVPVADHRDPARSTELEGRVARGTGAVAVAQIPGFGGEIDNADGGDAIAVPVADDGVPAGSRRNENWPASGPPALFSLRRYQVAVLGSKAPMVCWGRRHTVKVYVRLPVPPMLSVALIVIGNEPTAVGLPLNRPADDRVKPSRVLVVLKV